MSPLRLMRCAFAAVVVAATPALAQPPAPTPANPWFTAAAFPEASEEVLGAPHNGKLYAFSGLAPGFRAARARVRIRSGEQSVGEEEADAAQLPPRRLRRPQQQDLCVRRFRAARARPRRPGTRSTTPGSTTPPRTSGKSLRRCRPGAEPLPPRSPTARSMSPAAPIRSTVSPKTASIRRARIT